MIKQRARAFHTRLGVLRILKKMLRINLRALLETVLLWMLKKLSFNGVVLCN